MSTCRTSPQASRTASSKASMQPATRSHPTAPGAGFSSSLARTPSPMLYTSVPWNCKGEPCNDVRAASLIASTSTSSERWSASSANCSVAFEIHPLMIHKDSRRETRGSTLTSQSPSQGLPLARSRSTMVKMTMVLEMVSLKWSVARALTMSEPVRRSAARHHMYRRTLTSTQMARRTVERLTIPDSSSSSSTLTACGSTCPRWPEYS
mmetsp:Transcript_80300/g.181195  ORF Transcript_80300/g.181195 Transcript_80300/m.181195 type:complete len:208 (+) Transcript_80300:136-759(+)